MSTTETKRAAPRDLSEPRTTVDAKPQRRRFNPEGNERLTAIAGLILLVLSALELGTLLGGLQHFLSLHVFVGLVLLPPIGLKLASTGWRFARYYTRNPDYRLRGAPQLLMRMLAPLLVLWTVVLFGSGVAMGVLHGQALDVARRLHGPSAFLWTVTLGAHVLVYLGRAIRSARSDARPSTRREARGAHARAWVAAAAIVVGLGVGAATLPAQHHWLHLPARHEHGDG
jgi:hypothetical protein